METYFTWWLRWNVFCLKAAIAAYEASCKIRDLKGKRHVENSR